MSDRGAARIRSAFDAIAGAPASTISPRIRQAIDGYEATSELIVGWTQLAGLALFFVLYAVSYSAFEVHNAVEPAPIGLAIYGAVTVWRLRLCRRNRLGPAIIYGSALLDVLVLMLMIASFPTQYEASAALYLKAPTLAYAFIIIALRALRFDPWLVVTTGLAAAIGWAILSAYAAYAGAPITFDYRVYMTSLSLLPGAELEKIAALLGFTCVLALSVVRQRRLLQRTAVEETAAADLSKFVGHDAAMKIRASAEGLRPGDGEIRQAAIMFIDLRGFTPATKELPPRLVIALLEDYQARVLPIIESGGGSVDKFLGDGVLVSFGAAAPTGREAADALATALAVDRAGRAWTSERVAAGQTPLDIAVAVASGEVIYGAVGYGDRLEFTVIGDPVNLSAKLEKHAKTEGARIIASRAAFDRARRQGFAGEALRLSNGARVEGASEPVDLVILA